MMAMMLVASAMAFAGDSPELKAILKAKTYEEAKQLLDATIGQLASSEEKAKAYNKLVDLALEKVNKETTIITENQLAEQMKTGKVQAYDTLGLAEAICNAINAAIECNKYDQQPNAKNKVSPKFADKNAQRVWVIRPNLVNIGQEEARKGNDAGVLKYWGAFLDSAEDPLFEKQDKKPEETYIGQVAFFTASYAYQAKEFARASKYCDIAMRDANERERALALKMTLMKEDLKTREDSLQYIDQLKALYAQDSSNPTILENIYNMYNAIGEKETAMRVLDEALAADPNNFVALADKGMALLGDGKTAEAVDYLRRAAQVKDDNAVILTYLGTSLCVSAQDLTDEAQKKAMYKEAIEAFDKAKQLDPDKLQSNWGYNRYNAYYNYYGPDAPETKQAEADSK